MFDEYRWVDLVEEFVFSDNFGVLFRNYIKSYIKFFLEL